IPLELREGESPVVIGRTHTKVAESSSKRGIFFKSKVVSRAHAEVRVEQHASGASPPRFFIRDTKSSAVTFLNHKRLSPANKESHSYELKDGDILQLGVD
ncbi:SMAD/FHA domain-containing protein, partial [Mycena crocata]